MLIAIGIIVVLIIIFVVMYNGFIRLKNNCDEAFATMDVYLKKRYDLIPNLVETVKGYAAHEKETLERVVAARNMAQGASTPEEKAAGESMLQGTLKSLFAVAAPEESVFRHFESSSSHSEDDAFRVRSVPDIVPKAPYRADLR